jgi:hypothetical protein
MMRSTFRSLLLSAVLAIAPFAVGCVADDSVGSGSSDITDVNHTDVERQSIGNCWLYAEASWVESMHLSATGVKFDISQSYWTYWHWYEQILDEGIGSEIETGGGFDVASDIVLARPHHRDEVHQGGRGRARCRAPEAALTKINDELKTAASRTMSARMNPALVRQVLDEAWQLTSSVKGALTKAFGKDGQKTFDSARHHQGHLDHRALRLRGRSTPSASPTRTSPHGQEDDPRRRHRRVERGLLPDVRRSSTASAATSRSACRRRCTTGRPWSSPGTWTSTRWRAPTHAARLVQPDDAQEGREAGRQGGHMTVLEDYEADHARTSARSQGGRHARPEQPRRTRPSSTPRCSPRRTVKFFRVKNSWGAFRDDRSSAPGMPGYSSRCSPRRRGRRGARRAQAGALATTFTASQGLLLMIPNMYKIAGELTPFVHARRGAHAGDARALDLRRPLGRDGLPADRLRDAVLGLGAGGAGHGGVAHAATLRARVPFLHFFDGFRTSHEVAKIETAAPTTTARAVDDEAIAAHRARAHARSPGAARHGAEPRRVLPGARGVQPVLRRVRPAVVATRWSASPRSPAAATAVRLRRPPRGRARDRDDGLGAETAHETSTGSTRRGEKRRRREVRLYRPFSEPSASSRRCRHVRAIAVLDRTKEPGAVGEPLYLDVVAALRRRELDGLFARPRVVGRPLRPLVEGVHARDGARGLRRARSRQAARTSPSASSTTSRTARSPTTRRSTSSRRRRARGVLRPRRRRHGRREQELDQDHRRGDRPLRAGLLRLRLEEVGRDHDLAPALRAAADPLAVPDHAARASSPATSSGFLERYDVLASRKRARRAPQRALARRRGVGTPARARCRRRSSKKLTLFVIDAERVAARRHRRPHQHRDADVLLRALRRAAARRGDREDQAARSRSPTASGATRSCGATSRPSIVARTPARGPVPAARDGHVRTRGPPPVPRTRPTSCSASQR